MRQTGLFNYADELYQRANIAGKFQYKPHKMITLGYSVRLTMDKNDKPSALDGLFYHNLGRRAPVVPVINSESGEYHQDSMIPAMKDGGRVINKTKKLYNQGSIVIEPIKNWKIHAEANSRLEWNPYDRNFNPLPFHLPSGKVGYMLVNEGVVASHNVNADGSYYVIPDYGETYAEDAETKVHYSIPTSIPTISSASMRLITSPSCWVSSLNTGSVRPTAPVTTIPRFRTMRPRSTPTRVSATR